jgi:hypothetical protein
MAPLTKLILIIQAECSEKTNLTVLQHGYDRFGFSNNGDSCNTDLTERIQELWEDTVLKQSSIQCDFYLEGFPSYHDDQRQSNDDDSAVFMTQNSSIKSSHQPNIMAFYHQPLYPCSIPQNLLSLNLTEGNVGPQEEVDHEIRASFTNCHFLVDPEAIFGGETADLRLNDALSSFLYMPLFPSPDSFSFSSRAEATSMMLVKEVPLVLDTSHAKRLFYQFYCEKIMTEPVDPITSSINSTSEIGTNITTNKTQDHPEKILEPIIESVAVPPSPKPDATVCKEDYIEVHHKIHRIVAATFALSSSTMLQAEPHLELLPTANDIVDTRQNHTILWVQQNERRQMIEQMLKQEMHQIHLILLTLCLATLGILFFLGYKLQSHSTEVRKNAVLLERGGGSRSLQQSSPPNAPDSPSGILKSTSQQVSPLSMDPNLFQMEPPLSPPAHPAAAVRSSASPCTKFWTNRRERRRQSYLNQSDINRRRRSPIRPTNGSALMNSPDPTHPPGTQTRPRIVSPEPFREQDASAKFENSQPASVVHENTYRTTADPLKPCSPPDIVVQHSSSFLEEYW